MVRGLLCSLIALSSSCSTTAPAPLMPPLDARWVGSLYEAPFGVVDQHLASIRDLVDDGMIEVLGYDARVVVRYMSGGPEVALLLTGKPEALALAHERIAGQGPSEGRVGWIIGFALTMSGKEGLAGPMWSVVLVPNLNGLDAVLDQVRGANPGNLTAAYPDFRAGKPPGAGPRTLLIVDAGWQDQRLLTQALYATGVPFRGLLYCQYSPLFSFASDN